MALCPGVASLTFNQLDRCNLLWRSGVCYGELRTANEEGSVVSHMELHFAVRFLIIGIALIYVVGPMLWHWREA